MAKPGRLALAKDNIFALFSAASQKVYNQAELAQLLYRERRNWHLSESTGRDRFIDFLQTHGELRTHILSSEKYGKEIVRYSWGEASPYELALALKSHAYLSHATAVTLHGLTELDRKTIYLNAEQSIKPTYPQALTQQGIDIAFSREQRKSTLIYKCDDISIVQIAGKNTKRLGVEEIIGPTFEAISVTNLQRTLIDIVIRPAYAGGVSQVLKAYRAAKDLLDVDALLLTLKKLDYVYPYHQAIGFLLQEAGYSQDSYKKLRTLGLRNDFYLTHGMKNPGYSEAWRLFYPRNLLK